MNNHSEMWSYMKLIEPQGPVNCACKPEEGIKCVLHANFDAYVIDQALNAHPERDNDIDDDDPSTHEIDCTCIMCIPGA